MADRDYTKECDRWNIGYKDEQRITNVVANVIADHIELAEKEFVKNVVAFIDADPETGEPSILIGFGENGPKDVYVPLSQAMFDAEQELFAKVASLLKEYNER